MISAFAMCRAASAAKRIISTAPIAKFGATNTLARRPSRGLAQLVEVEAGRPDHDVHAGRERTRSALATPVSGSVKSTTHVGVAEHVRERRAERRVGAADELHVLGALDRRADGLPHAPRGAGDGDADHAAASGAVGAGRDRRLAAAVAEARPRRARSGDRQPLGREQLVGQRARSSSVTASIRSIISSTERIGSSRAAEAPSRFMRAPVDSSDEHDAALEVLLRARQLLLGGRVARSASSSAATTSSASARLSARVPT